MHHIETKLDRLKSKDLPEQAIDLEDEEVLEGVGLATQHETTPLQNALKRIDAGTFSECENCGTTISGARLSAVPYALLCRKCATEAEHDQKQ